MKKKALMQKLQNKAGVIVKNLPQCVIIELYALKRDI